MILMRQVEPRLGAKKGVCMAAAGREDPSLLDSLGPEGESEQVCCCVEKNESESENGNGNENE